MLGLPHAFQGAVAVGVKQRGGAVGVEGIEAFEQQLDAWMARFGPLAPVGGTVWAASPARNRFPWRMGVVDEAAERQDHLVDDCAFFELEPVCR